MNQEALLAAVSEAAVAVRNADAAALAAHEARDEAIMAALEGGCTTRQVADAVGVSSMQISRIGQRRKQNV